MSECKVCGLPIASGQDCMRRSDDLCYHWPPVTGCVDACRAEIERLRARLAIHEANSGSLLKEMTAHAVTYGKLGVASRIIVEQREEIKQLNSLLDLAIDRIVDLDEALAGEFGGVPTTKEKELVYLQNKLADIVENKP